MPSLSFAVDDEITHRDPCGTDTSVGVRADSKWARSSFVREDFNEVIGGQNENHQNMANVLTPLETPLKDSQLQIFE